MERHHPRAAGMIDVPGAGAAPSRDRASEGILQLTALERGLDPSPSHGASEIRGENRAIVRTPRRCSSGQEDAQGSQNAAITAPAVTKASTSGRGAGWQRSASDSNGTLGAVANRRLVAPSDRPETIICERCNDSARVATRQEVLALREVRMTWRISLSIVWPGSGEGHSPGRARCAGLHAADNHRIPAGHGSGAPAAAWTQGAREISPAHRTPRTRAGTAG
jgi:hypothetical protein